MSANWARIDVRPLLFVTTLWALISALASLVTWTLVVMVTIANLNAILLARMAAFAYDPTYASVRSASVVLFAIKVRRYFTTYFYKRKAVTSREFASVMCRYR